MTTSSPMQPFLHDLVTTLCGTSVTLSLPSGDIDGHGAEGFYLGDRRMLRVYAVRIFGRPLDVVASRLHADGVLDVRAVARDGSESTPDPTLLFTRQRHQTADGFAEQWRVDNFGLDPRTVDVELRLATDFASMIAVKAGQQGTDRQPQHTDVGALRFSDGSSWCTVQLAGPDDVTVQSDTIRWRPTVAAGGSSQLSASVAAANPLAAFHAPRDIVGPGASLHSSDHRLDELFEWGMADLQRLMLADPQDPTDHFAGAGSPWYLTLFGRDSLWTARLSLPFGTSLAASTLRVLARRQGVAVHLDSAEQPGRILHEQRSEPLDLSDATMPARYFGSIDATPLWISTLAEARAWGMPIGDVRQLAPALQAAVRWLLDHADANGDGLVEYIDHSGHGLSNQGWKDSADSVNWFDGRLAEAPIALCEVQGYAYAAAHHAAALLNELGLEGAAELGHFAARLRTSFNERFWIDDGSGPFVAIAVDGAGGAVDGVASNAGHLLGTGLLDAEQEALVVHRLVHDLACPGGLRTLSAASARFNPVSYHNGSIWPHDVAICARGMVLAGFPHQAATLLHGLLVAVKTFGGRLPELYCYTDSAGVTPYPASCRPQAWSAAASAVAAWACTPVIPADGQVQLLEPAPVVERVEIDGMMIDGRVLRTRLADGVASVIDKR